MNTRTFALFSVRIFNLVDCVNVVEGIIVLVGVGAGWISLEDVLVTQGVVFVRGCVLRNGMLTEVFSQRVLANFGRFGECRVFSCRITASGFKMCVVLLAVACALILTLEMETQ